MEEEGFMKMEEQQELDDSPLDDVPLEDQWFERGGSGAEPPVKAFFPARDVSRDGRSKSKRAPPSSGRAAAGKRPGKRPAREPTPPSSEEAQDDELDIGGYLFRYGMDYRQQILYCRAYASMLAAKLKAQGRRAQ